MKPLMYDLFSGLGGASEGFIAEGWDCIGIDIERHEYGDEKYPAELWIRDILTIHGSELKNADFIWASPPCQEYSYMAMPWSRAKAKQADIEADTTGVKCKQLTALFDACFRIQREAIEAAGHFIPMVIENVRGANKWVGRSRANFGSFHLWGDVPALMPMTKAIKQTGHRFDPTGNAPHWDARNGVKMPSETGRRTDKGKGARFTSDCDGAQPGPRLVSSGVKSSQSGAAWREGIPRDKMLGNQGPAAFGSKSNARKAASAQIAKIPFELSSYIARHYYPLEVT